MTISHRPPTSPRPASTVVARPVEDGAVLFDTRSDVYFGLNAVGARVWSLLQRGGSSEASLVDAITAEYPDVPRDRIASDVAGLLEALQAHGLIELAGP